MTVIAHVEHAVRDNHTSSNDKPNKAFSLALGTNYPYFAITLHLLCIISRLSIPQNDIISSLAKTFTGLRKTFQ